MQLNDWFHKGITPAAYRNDLDKHQENFYHIYENFDIPVEDMAFLKSKSSLRIVAIAEVWCGHCMLDVAIMMRMAEAANIDVSMLPRDEHLELMDQYKVDGKRYIPIFVFIDESGKEVGKWGPMTNEIKEMVQTYKEKANLPDKADPGYTEAFRNYANEITDTFVHDQTVWANVYEDIKKALA